MSFSVLPTLGLMKNLYTLPRTQERFEAYLKLLEGNHKGDLAYPISGYNPKAKDHILTCIENLEKLNAEQIVEETLEEINQNFIFKTEIKVALNISDDLLGGWTNRFTGDYDGKFKINALASRGFCTPILWSSEVYSPEKIKLRILGYALRTFYWFENKKIISLEDHVNQEVFVAQNCKIQTSTKMVEQEIRTLKEYYFKNKNSEDYSLIFNFFYGNKASESLSFAIFGLPENVFGFDLAHFLA
jgi:hypothetical protein